jgi:radical SAM family protein
MSRFPLRLQVALAKARLLHGHKPVRYLPSEEILHPQSQQPVSHEAVRDLIRHHHSIVWIGGSEPLAHPGIGHLVRLIAQRGQFTFLETNAIVLRQRIHEFQPLPRFYFVVRFLGTQAEHDRRAGRPGAFRAAIEGIRAAQLSGFLICAKMEWPSVGAREAAQLRKDLHALDLDGIIGVGSGRDASSSWNRLWRTVELARVASVTEVTLHGPLTQLSGAKTGDCEQVRQVP